MFSSLFLHSWIFHLSNSFLKKKRNLELQKQMFGSKFLFENIEKYFLTKNHIGFSKQVIIYLNTYEFKK